MFPLNQNQLLWLQSLLLKATNAEPAVDKEQEDPCLISNHCNNLPPTKNH